MIGPPILSPNDLSWRLKVPRSTLEDLKANAVHHYHPFPLPRPGKKPRWIDNPDRPLKYVLRRIYGELLKPLVFPEHLHGGIQGRSARTNALPHLGKRMVVRLDLEDFFPSVTDRQVYSIWRQRFGCSPPVANLLTALTTYHQRLPQGAPTSTALANLVLLDVDREIQCVASGAGIDFTRFVDDLALSGDSPQELIGAVVQALGKAGFRVSRGKLKIMPASSRQEVTGQGVNSQQGPSISRQSRHQVRAAIHQLGLIPRDAEFTKFVESIRGRIAHIEKTNPGSARKLLRDFEIVISA